MVQLRLVDYEGSNGVRALGDDALVAALLEGDVEAGRLFFERHAPLVQRLASRILGTSDVEDVVQDIFLEALRSLGSLRDRSNLRGWLIRVAVFTARKRIRSRTRNAWLRFLAPEDVDANTMAVDEGVDEAVHATFRILDQLDVDERVAFSLRYVEGMTNDEIASATDVSLATVKRRLSRATTAFTDKARQEPALAAWVDGGEP
jgi:RNA polymerase sigma-70 factor (ECF subfamily)